MKTSSTYDPRLVIASTALDNAASAASAITDPRAKGAVEELTRALRALSDVLADWQADENGWQRPSAGGQKPGG